MGVAHLVARLHGRPDREEAGAELGVDLGDALTSFLAIFGAELPHGSDVHGPMFSHAYKNLRMA